MTPGKMYEPGSFLLFLKKNYVIWGYSIIPGGCSYRHYQYRYVFLQYIVNSRIYQTAFYYYVKRKLALAKEDSLAG